MKRIALLFILVFTTLMLFSAHNLTINGAESTTVSLGDDLEIYFEYESVGNSATISLMIDIPLIDTSDFDFFQGQLIDGGPLDTTPLDGVFQGSITAFWQPPTGIPLLITVTDEDISAQATVTFIELNSTFSISGNISQESNYGFNLPVYPALVNIFYNLDMDDMDEIDFEGGIEEWLAFFETRYIISELNSLMGNYSAAIPDSIDNVSCLVMPLSLLDFEETHTPPDPYFGEINGAVSNIDFLYTQPDGYFTGTVMGENGQALPWVAIELYTQEEDYAYGYTDETGAFSIPLDNGTYTYMVMAWDYEPYYGEVTMNDQDIYQDIYLVAVANHNQEINPVPTISVSNYPNPFHESVKIEVKSSLNSPISVKIYNLKGQLVKTFTENYGSNANFVWQGKDSNNNQVANGIYYLRVKQGNHIVSKKVVLMK